MLLAALAVALGGAGGALARWVLSAQLNHFFPAIPPGTLASNIVGGYIVGVAIAFFAARPDLPPEWRLFIITGFCGGLTTFSTFSAEVVMLIQQYSQGFEGNLGYASALSIVLFFVTVVPMLVLARLNLRGAEA